MRKTNKNILLKYRKQRNNYLPKYDLAIKPSTTSTGYQQGDQVNTSSFTSTPSQNLQPAVSAINNATTQNAINKTAGFGTNLASMPGWTVPAVATTTAATIAPSFVATIPGTQAWMPSTTTTITGRLSPEVIQSATGISSASSTGASSATTSALGTAGTVAGYLGAAYGAYDMLNNWFSDNSRTEGEMMQSSGTATQSAEGVDYTTYTGVDQQAERDYQSALNTGQTVNAAISGAGSGAMTGLLAGGPLGALFGGLGGGLIGLVGGLFGGSARQRELSEKLQRLNQTFAGRNLMSEAVASSQGLRNKFNSSHGETSGVYNADRGMDAYMSPKSKTAGEYRPVWTPDGVEYGPVGSLVGKGESIIDYDRGKASLINKGTKRVDNQASIAQEGDNIIIAGNDRDWETGESFANLVAPYTKMVEHANNIIDNINKKGSPATQELQKSQAEKMKLYALNKMKPITDRQQLQHEYEAAQQEGLYRANKGMDAHMPKYKRAFKNIFEREAANLLPYAIQLVPAVEQMSYYKGNSPYAESPYASNMTARQALGILGRLRNDSYTQLKDAADSNRQGLYTVNNIAGITPGQRLAMITAQNDNYAKLRQSIIANNADTNNKYKQAYASALLQEGRDDAKMRMQANTIQQEAYRQAVAKKRKGIETAALNINNVINSALSNRFKLLMSGKTLDMYQQELDNERERIARDYRDRQQNKIILPQFTLPQNNLPVWRDGFIYDGNIA